MASCQRLYGPSKNKKRKTINRRGAGAGAGSWRLEAGDWVAVDARGDSRFPKLDEKDERLGAFALGRDGVGGRHWWHLRARCVELRCSG